jgi:4-amino-4-deoxy-L-arabinose transferase-like glycosyltransferase
MRVDAFALGLAAIVGLAALLRFWSIGFGLPLITHPDEPLIYDAADRMVSSRTLNPGWFRYPAFIIDIEAGILTGVYTLDRATGLSDETTWTLAYGGGRAVMAAFGVLSVLLVGLLGRRVTRHALAALDDAALERAASVGGLVAAGLLALSFIHIKDSHFLKPDVPAAFFATLTLWLALDAWERRDPTRWRPWLLAGAAVGLAAAAKYTGAVVAVVPATALLLVWLPARRSGAVSLARVAAVASAMALVSVAVFLLFNPYVALAPHEFLSPVDGIRAEMDHYRSGHDGAEGTDTWLWYLAEVWRNGFGPMLTPLVFLGLAAALWHVVRRRRGAGALVLVLVFIPVYYATIAPYPVRFDRQLMPILPYLAILGGFGVAVSIVWSRVHVSSLAGRADRPWMATLVPALVLVVLALSPLIKAAEWDNTTGKRDTRYAALAWIERNVPPGTVIAREWHTPPLAQAGYRDLFVRSIQEQPLAWYRAAGVEYVVLSSFMYQRYLDAPDQYPAYAAFYDRLLSLSHSATFEGANGPEIVIMRLEDAAPAFGSQGAWAIS